MTVATRPAAASGIVPRVDVADRATEYAHKVVDGQIVAGRLVRLACERHLRDIEYGHERGLRWDPALSEKAIDFFLFVHHFEGPKAGQPVELELWQCFSVGSIFGWQRWSDEFNRWIRRFRKAFNEVAKKNGKAVSLDTPIPTPTGWVTMGELHAGDQVIDENGQPTTVTFATEVQYDHDCYRVTFSDHTSVVADAEHLWQTEELRHGYQASVKTTRDVAGTLSSRADGARNHRIPVARPLDLPATDLLLDPYVLGVWLGDGDSNGAVLTVGDEDEELVTLVASAGAAVYPRRSPHRATRYRLGGTGASGSRSEVSAALRQLGVIRNKHIPAAYLRSSIEQRLALLQGLMDTDGHVTPRGQCEFTTTRPQLRDGFLELARSLGYKPVSREGVATLNGRAIGPKWRISFHGQRDRAPFRLARKLLRVAGPRTRDARSTTRQIVSVEAVPSVPVRCITVDSSSHLYLVGDGMVPTHNTLTAGGVGLRLAFFDDEAGAQVYAAATKRDQAKIVWGGAKTMTAQSPALRARISARVLSLYDAATASSFRPLGRDAGGEDGINPSAVIIDEEHRHEDRELINVLGQSMGARMQPLLYIITTAGTTGESVWADDHDYAVRVLEGLVDDDALFAVIYTLDEKDDPFDEANWPKSNPNLGVSLTWSEMRQRAQEAREMPANLNDFLRLRLDVRTQSTTRWMAPEEWAACSAPVDALAGRLAYGGLDLGSRSDLAAFLAIVPVPGDDELLDVVCRFWCPEDGVEQRSKRDRVPYDVWVREGWITATPGNVTDYDRIRADLNLFIGVDPDAEEQSIDFADLYELGYDPHDATQLSTQLQSDGFRLVRIMQSTAELDAPVKEVERLVASRKLRHGGNPVLAWMVDNALMVQDAAGRRRPDKEKARDKIDGVPALLMAVKRWMANAGAEDVWTAA